MSSRFLPLHVLVLLLSLAYTVASEEIEDGALRFPKATVFNVVRAGMNGEYGLGSPELWDAQSNSFGDTCAETPSLTLEKVQSLAGTAWGSANTSVAVQNCPIAKVFNSAFGKACQYSQKAYFGSLYDSGIYLMVLGAERKRSFSPFAHARVLARSLQVCQPKLHRDGMVTIPDSYQVLYELYFTNLIAELRSTSKKRKRSFMPSPSQMKQLVESVKSKRNQAISSPLYQKVGLDVICSQEDVLKMTTLWREHDSEHSVREVLLDRFPILKAVASRSREQCSKACEAHKSAGNSILIENCALNCVLGTSILRGLLSEKSA